MHKTKIDWCDSSWNPVTGCLHGCEYCYARRIARRFCFDPWNTVEDGINHFVGLPMQNEHYKDGKIDPYPYGFDPTFHRCRLDQPGGWKKPRTIFVCSMADLFGDWVPDEWIGDVFAACEAAPQHRYLFLTKNPARYERLYEKGLLPDAGNLWFGTTVTGPDDLYAWFEDTPRHGFVSIEPILQPFGTMEAEHWPEWVIIGAETGTRRGKVVPEKKWIDDIAGACDEIGTPVFMKESIRGLMGTDFKQEYPWEQAST